MTVAGIRGCLDNSPRIASSYASVADPVGAVHGEQVAVEYPGAHHAVAAYAQQVIRSAAEQSRIDFAMAFDMLDGQHGRAGSHAPDHRKAQCAAGRHGRFCLERVVGQANAATQARVELDEPLAFECAQMRLRGIRGGESERLRNLGPGGGRVAIRDGVADEFIDAALLRGEIVHVVRISSRAHCAQWS